MTVDRSEITEANILEDRTCARRGKLRSIGRSRPIQLRTCVRTPPGRAGSGQVRKIRRDGADRGGDRHLVVVQDDNQAVSPNSGVIQRFVSHARGQRAIPDNRDDIVIASAEIANDGHSERGRDRGRSVRGAEWIVFAFAAFGEAGQPTPRPQRVHSVATACQDLVRVGLVTHVPNETVLRGLENIMQGDS